MAAISVRFATPDDAADILRLVRALAAYENEPVETVKMTEADVRAHGFGDQPKFEVLLAELAGRPVGFALFFQNYSTWEGRPGIYLEDLFVEPHARGLGLGRKLIAQIAAVARSRGYWRVDLAVLDWNPTREFYHRIGIEHQARWLPYRMTRSAIVALAAEADSI